MSHRPKILVTGATGFLGGRVVERLVLENRANVRVLVRAMGRAARIASLPIEYSIGDVLDLKTVENAVRGCDFVINCASSIEAAAAPEETSTYQSAKNAAHACASAKVPLVHVSSCSVYGTVVAGRVDESTPMRPRHGRDVYAKAKIAAEQLIKSLGFASGLNSSIIQPTMIYGPHSVEWTLSPLAMLNASSIAMPLDDRSACNAVYVDDVVSAAFLAMKACGTSCPSYLINGSEQPTWSAFLGRYAALGTTGRVKSLSSNEMRQITRAEKRSRSLSRVLIKVLRQHAEARAAVLSSPMVGGSLNLLQRLVPRQAFEAFKKSLRGSQPARAVTTAASVAPDPPVKLPPPHYLTLAGQSAVYDFQKAVRDLGYAPEFGLDRAFDLIGRWARWSRLLPALQD